MADTQEPMSTRRLDRVLAGKIFGYWQMVLMISTNAVISV